ncbi:MAG: LuxR C-terminal-related transcriptional regulator, partial [Cyanobacteria bacterium J06649_4]
IVHRFVVVKLTVSEWEERPFHTLNFHLKFWSYRCPDLDRVHLMEKIEIRKIGLQDLFCAIAQAPTEDFLRESVMSELGQYFAANRWGLFFSSDFFPEGKEANATRKDLPPLMQRAISLEFNPVLRYLVQRHSAVHDEVVLPPGVWKTLCPRADHGHVLTGPLIFNGELVGGVGFTRHRDQEAFNAGDLADLSALCLHLSSQLTRLRMRQNSLPVAPFAIQKRLTPRELEIAALVAQGLTNKKIGETLWITENTVKQALKRMYRKLEVSSRAEMVAELVSQSTDKVS